MKFWDRLAGRILFPFGPRYNRYTARLDRAANQIIEAHLRVVK